MTFQLLDLTSEPDAAPLDPYTASGLDHAARGDWHAAAEAFTDALATAERATDALEDHERDARLAVALTNLGQAQAQIGALDDAAALLERSAAVRERLCAAGAAGPAVHARGLVDLAAVRGAAGGAAGARDALRHAVAAIGDADVELTRTLAQGLALLDA